MRYALAVAMIVLCAATARAEREDAACIALDTTPGAPLVPAPASGIATPIPWTEFALEGELVDDRATVHAMLEPTLAHYRTSLTAKVLREDISKITARLGYQLVATDSRDYPGGVLLILKLQPLPIVRHVVIDVNTKFYHLFDKLLDDEVQRRMQIRIGSYLPSDAPRRTCLIAEETRRLEDYLHDEGYFDAIVKLDTRIDGGRASIVTHVSLGDEYKVCTVNIVKPQNGDSGDRLAVSDADIKAQFEHKAIRWFTSRFTRTQHQEDLQRVRDLFHKHGYPTARVSSNLNDPEALHTSFDRNSKCMTVTLSIDQRRHVDIRFEGNNREQVTDEYLRDQLTFDKAGSTDDVEAAASARAIADKLQDRGMFDARVTFTRERLPEFDKLVFHIEQGKGREVRSVEFIGNDKAENSEFNDKILSGIVATKAVSTVGDLLGTNTNATSQKLATDIDRIREYYRRAGYREAQVGVTASPGCPVGAADCGTGDAAFASALVESGLGNDLYVRFTIEPGEQTKLARVQVEAGDADATKLLAGPLCAKILGELANELKGPELARRSDLALCTGSQPSRPFREDEVSSTKDRLREFLIKLGRPRAELEYEARVIGPHQIEAHYKLRTAEERKIGNIVIRGAFRTKRAIIEDELGLHEGEPLTSDALAEGARKLRATGLFDAVNIDPLDLGGDSESVNMIVRVEERFDYKAQIDLEGGYSSYNGIFGTTTAKMSNLWGTGASLNLTGTYGTKIQDVEGTFRLPQYLVRHWTSLELQTELTGLYRLQDTPRFGWLTTEGVSLGVSHLWREPKTPARPRAHTESVGVHYDFRLRTRNVDALRPIGADTDDTQVAISTRTGSIGVTGDADGRVDRSGQLSPLAAAEGYHLGATVALAFPEIAPLIGGQDTFIKASVTASKFISIGDNLVIRGDFRYDEGFPLGGAVLLPDVERFFAGGDNTVRGFQDDRLATEIVRVGVPPLGNLSQIRVIPAGGNIRMLSSIDAQYRIYWIMAGAVFTDAGMITNQWSTVTEDDIRPSVGTGLRFLSPFGIGAIEYAVPIHPHLGDDPRGRYHFYFAARAQF